MKTSMVFAAVGLMALSAVCGAQAPAGITPEMINTTLPEEGAPKAEAGPYAVTVEGAFGEKGLRTFRPSSLEGFPKKDTLPVVVWGNGGCAVENARYNGFLTTIASHGFLVITTTGPQAPGGGPGAGPPGGTAPGAAAPAGPPSRRATADDLKGAVDWADRENGREGSPLKGKIDTRHVAVMGQSCGGFLSIALGGDPRVGTIGVFNSGAQPGAPMDALKKVHGPVLLINGGDRDFLMGLSKTTFDAIDTLPTFYGSRHGAGHTATVYHPGGGEFANVAWKWAAWQFKGDKKAGAMFAGAKCDLCTNSNWDTASKHLK